MGLLAPIYIAGILAIGIPILLHLIRRTPQGRQMFSSLMFLSPSPPRLTRRSRLSNVLLLLLRAAVVTLLAVAFARPFFHWGANEDKQLSAGRRILFLVDTSASMRRPELWTDARKQAEVQLADVKVGDEVGLYFFDRQMHPALTFAQWNQADPAQRVTLFRAALAQGSPGWSSTRLGEALAAAADLASENSSAAADVRRARSIVLITDLQEGAKAEALQGHEWPKDVSVQKLTPLAVKKPGNASIQWTDSTPEMAEATRPAGPGQTNGAVRVRVSNEGDSTREQFTLTWHNDKGALADPPISVYVPPGRSQIVKVPLPAEGTQADRLVLAGDECDFDNTLYIVPPRAETLRVLYLGNDDVTDVNGQLYYLRSALFDTPLRKLDLVARKSAEAMTAGDVAGIRLAVVARPPTDAELGLLKQYVQGGGDLLWVGWNAETLQRAGALVGQNLQVAEAAGEYALLNRIELSDPVFAPFVDARFADFTKIHFWKHRQLKWEAAAGDAWRVRASFDDGSPFMVTATLAPAAGGRGVGTIYVLTSGWSPVESQLALSSKFVPILEQFIRRKGAFAMEGRYVVDDAMTLPGGPGEMVTPDGKVVALASDVPFSAARPGVYHWKAGGEDIPVAVNLAPEESRTKPGNIDDLAQWGVRFSTSESVQIAAERQRVLLNNELENRQKTWRWILLAVLGLLVVETALAGRLSRRSASLERAAP
jgi:hypothetical protein